MKANTSIEQAICAVIMIALQEGHRPVSGTTLAGWLEISESYLMKTMRKLAVAGIVDSHVQRGGGYTLARPLDEIGVGDVVAAVGGEPTVTTTGLPERIFPDGEHTASVVGLLNDSFAAAGRDYLEALNRLSLADLVRSDAVADGAVDWASRLDT
ncbi:RrF2 family transcriptional regulator [Bifidobacterium choloepi]|uniref:Rrf2 family transcriptional regulator n=1 Tax=Bifidobacterium choloepi TaxID=2614131 RepID=A0A6I5N292_9BIFI|nr:Rrf2 family transcriptional regulator [Bifidobacterium choloepi]NEG70606.1 Rrf2 family transcriptional regulator [Bifidobacterium choloepi]